jgi:hypothetical protein
MATGEASGRLVAAVIGAAGVVVAALVTGLIANKKGEFTIVMGPTPTVTVTGPAVPGPTTTVPGPTVTVTSDTDGGTESESTTDIHLADPFRPAR